MKILRQAFCRAFQIDFSMELLYHFGMKRDRNSKRRNAGGNNRRRDENNGSRSKKGQFRGRSSVSAEQMAAEDEAIRVFKSQNQPVCPRCGKVITDLATALPDHGDGVPIHFECAMDIVSDNETLGEGDKIAYIGQGRFGVLNYPNIRDVRHFTIRKIIEWESREGRAPWRDEMSELFSQVR